MPAISQSREFTAGGRLMSYSGGFAETDGQAGIYTGRILKCEKQSDLPVLRTTQVEFSINLKTAKKLGFSIPLSLLSIPDEVIE